MSKFETVSYYTLFGLATAALLKYLGLVPLLVAVVMNIFAQ